MRRDHPESRKREGMAMLIVMLVLLAATATATFAVHSTSFEIRASGYGRQALQTRYVAESGLQSSIALAEQETGRNLVQCMEQGPVVTMAPFEPELASTVRGCRQYLADFDPTLPPIETDTSIGPSLGNVVHQPMFAVDVNDRFQGPAPPGENAVTGDLHYYYFTFTSRGRTRLASDYRSSGDTRDYHEGASDARAIVLLGPMPR